MLGALALGDIGKHFPDTDNTYKGIDSKVLLQRCYDLIREKGYSIVNVDSTLLLQAPKISVYVEQMQHAIAGILHLTIHDVSIKATTTEHLSFIGREEGVVDLGECHAPCGIHQVRTKQITDAAPQADQ